MVALRLTIGWHFLSEGLTKLTSETGFSSAGFLSQAVGPFADFFHGMVPDVHGWKTIVDAPGKAGDVPADGDAAPPYEEWAEGVADSWQVMADRIAERLAFTEAQKETAAKFVAARQEQFSDYIDENSEDLDTYLHELGRWTAAKNEEGAQSIPFKRDRITKKQYELDAQAYEWKNWVKYLEIDLRTDLLAIADTQEQRELARSYRAPMSGSTAMDRFVTYSHVTIGACLMAGLFTRLASLGGAGFLTMVVATQPPWVVGAAPVYYQVVELAALLALATTAVGRWGGLDYFVHYCLIRPCCTAKGGD